jgi:hypothetical protein
VVEEGGLFFGAKNISEVRGVRKEVERGEGSLRFCLLKPKIRCHHPHPLYHMFSTV